MEKINFGGWPNCIRLCNDEIELIITLDVGPRIISCGFINKQNLLYVAENDKGKTGGEEWNIFGGHRLWHAPEVMPRTYFPDNKPVGHTWDGKTLRLRQGIENTTGIVKEMDITLDHGKNHVTILHRLVNKNLWAIETSPWAITAHAGGGIAIVPQEPYIRPEDELLPARPVVLWNYTHMADPRWTWGNRYIQLRHDSKIPSEQKIGVLNKQGWSAYINFGVLMVKRFNFDPEAVYPDYGCNNEVYVNENLLETETLGPVNKILPGTFTEHTEDWYFAFLSGKENNYSEDKIDNEILPLVNSLIR